MALFGSAWTIDSPLAHSKHRQLRNQTLHISRIPASAREQISVQSFACSVRSSEVRLPIPRRPRACHVRCWTRLQAAGCSIEKHVHYCCNLFQHFFIREISTVFQHPFHLDFSILRQQQQLPVRYVMLNILFRSEKKSSPQDSNSTSLQRPQSERIIS